MKEAWDRSSRTSDGFYSSTTPMSVYAHSCYDEGCKLESELITAQNEIGELKALLVKGHGAVTISRNGYIEELEHKLQEHRLALESANAHNHQLMTMLEKAREILL
jgi:hypothetical protein